MSTGPVLKPRRLGPNAVRVAIVTALLIVAAVALLVASGATAGTYQVRAVFDDVRGLLPGGEVRAGAISVGEVTVVELNTDDEPEVTMRIEDDFPLHEGATADIRLGSNVGAVNRTVELTQGDITKPELPDGTVLAGAATEQPVNFDLAIQTLDPPTRADIRRFLIGLGEAFANRGPDIDRTLKYSSTAVNETANLVAQVNSDGEALRTLVDQGARLTSAIASSPDEIGGAAAETATLLAATGRRQAELAEAVRLLGPGLSGGRRALEQLAASTPRLNHLVSELTPVAKELKPFAKELPHTIKAAGPFLTQTRKLVKGGPKDLRALDPIIRAAEPIATDFPPVIENATPLAKDLTAYIPETIGFFQNFGAATGSYDRVGHLVNLATGLTTTPPASTTGTTIKDDECTPGQLKKPFTRLPGTNECQPWHGYQDAFDSLDPKNGD